MNFEGDRVLAWRYVDGALDPFRVQALGSQYISAPFRQFVFFDVGK